MRRTRGLADATGGGGQMATRVAFASDGRTRLTIAAQQRQFVCAPPVSCALSRVERPVCSSPLTGSGWAGAPVTSAQLRTLS